MQNVTNFLRNKPFAVPGAPPPQSVVAGHVSPSSPLGDIEMVDMSPQARAAAGGNFQMEHLDSSPGSTLRTRSRNANRDDLDESIDILTESPGNKNRRRNVTKESQEVRNRQRSFIYYSLFRFSANKLKLPLPIFTSSSTPTFSFLSCDPRTMARSDRQS